MSTKRVERALRIKWESEEKKLQKETQIKNKIEHATSTGRHHKKEKLSKIQKRSDYVSSIKSRYASISTELQSKLDEDYHRQILQSQQLYINHLDLKNNQS